MILDIFLQALQFVVEWFIDLLPDITFTMPDISGITTGVRTIMYFTTAPVFSALVFSTAFWLVAQPAVGIVKFMYRKIPGIS